MRLEKKAMVLSALAMACAPVVASATVLFTDDFDAGTSASRYDSFSQDNDAAADPPFDTNANFAFDYGAFKYWHISADESNQNEGTFIPSAPRSVGNTTIGLRLDANDATPTGTAIINLYPKVSEFLGAALPTGDHKLTFDVWMNYNGRFQGGGGSTEFFTAGVNQAGGGIGAAIPVGDPNLAGFGLAVSGEGQNNLDYRLYRNNTRLGTLDQESGYVAVDEGPGLPGPPDSRNQFYKNLFPFVNPNNPTEQWYETPGGIGKHWTTVEMKVEDGIIYYYMTPDDGTKTLIAARTDETVSSGNVMVGYSDLVATGVAALETGDGSVTAHDANFGIIDNIEVETVSQTRPKWNVNANGNWSNAGNWLNGVPNGNEKTADFTDAISGSGKTVTVDSDHTIRAMVFDNAQPYTLAAGGGKVIFDSLTTGIFGTIKVKNGNPVINAPIDTNRILWTDVAGSNTLTINSQITPLSAGRYIKKTGTGTLLMSAANQWAGDVRVEGGTLRVTANGVFNNSTFTNTVSTGGTLDTNGFNMSIGTLAVNGGTVSGSGTVTVESHLRSTGGGTINANVAFSPSIGFTGHRELVSANTALTINGVISGAPKLHQYSTGTDPSIILNGTNTYTGATAIRGGTLIVASNAPSGAPGALGNSTSTVEVGDSTVTLLTNVRAASTANVNGTFSAGTLTVATTTVDGVALADGDRILVKNQTYPEQNGIYVRTNATTWTRASDLDESSELAYGKQVTVTAGTTNINRKYYLFDAGNLAMNTAPQTWGQEIANASLLTGGAVTIGRNVSVLNTVNTGVSTVGGNTAHSSTFSGTVTLGRNTTLTAAAGGTVNFTGPLVATGVNVTKAGAGNVVVNNIRTNALSVTAGTMTIASSGGAFSGTSKVSGLTLSAGTKLDITDNKLIVSAPLGTHNGTNYTGVAGLVESGRNTGFWNGNGITTSMPDATSGSNYTMLGVATGAEVLGLGPTDTATWGGQTAAGADSLVMYTYGGDANLSGFVDIDDYGQIDFNASTGGVLTGWFNGDFDYNGIQDIDDYGIIDFVVNIQGPAFPTTGGMTISAIPEPASVALLGVLTGGLAARRRRRA